MMLLYTKNAEQSIFEIVLLVIALCGLLLIVWWRRHITYNYREAVEQQNVERLENSFEEYKINTAEKDLQLAVYSKLFHYLNKAVPDCALFAESAAEQSGSADARALLEILQRVLREMNLAYEKCSLQNVPKTGVSGIDAPIIQLFAAAERKNFDVSADISEGVEGWFARGKIDKDDIYILLRYLCDNAMISALGSTGAKVRVELGGEEKPDPIIRIYDSGNGFDEEVLAKLGLEQITTRAGVGGSGIGLFTVFQILAKYGASFTLDEAPKKNGFTKCIEIVFDGRHTVTVRTCREGVIAACAARKDMTVERVESSCNEAPHDGTNG
ncbi:MAG: ATP-binding protein [Clostridia bacterium]|nr:ATP-binding protein [Clostridia bacterium]